MRRQTRAQVTSGNERMWNWTFWVAILAFEIAGVFLSANA